MLTLDHSKNQGFALDGACTSSSETNQSNAVFDYLYHNHPPPGVDVALSDVSKRDSVWDKHRDNTHTVGDIFGYHPDFVDWSLRMQQCSTFLQFRNDKGDFKLSRSFFCHVRHCPVCQWRKSLYIKARTHQALANLGDKYPSHRFVFLTLTVANPPVSDLRDCLAYMNKAWKRLIERKEFDCVVDGWVRSTEITRDVERPNTHAHPHFHAVLMVKSNYFAKNYITHSRWLHLWADCLRADYLPSVDVRAVKPKKSAVQDGSYWQGVSSVVAEVIKYAVKPSDLIGDGSLQSNHWLYTMCEQVKGLRFLATGGVLKNAFKATEAITSEEMINTESGEASEGQSEQDTRRLNFTYYGKKRRYLYNPLHNE